MKRPSFIKHFSEIQESEPDFYPGSEEPLGLSASFSRLLGLKRIGIHHQVLKAGCRTSYPHAESTEDEFIYVIAGTPQVWVDGHLHDLKAGDGVVFEAGTGICHTFINNSEEEAQLLVVGERREDNLIYYPHNPGRKPEVKGKWWNAWPPRTLGDHDGKPNK